MQPCNLAFPIRRNPGTIIWRYDDLSISVIERRYKIHCPQGPAAARRKYWFENEMRAGWRMYRQTSSPPDMARRGRMNIVIRTPRGALRWSVFSLTCWWRRQEAVTLSPYYSLEACDMFCARSWFAASWFSSAEALLKRNFHTPARNRFRQVLGGFYRSCWIVQLNSYRSS